RCRERLDGGIRREVRHIVFLPPGRPPLADEPDLVTRHALHTVIEHPVLMAIRNADTAGREETCQPTFGAPPPTAPLPFAFGQKPFSDTRGRIRAVVLAGLS